MSSLAIAHYVERYPVGAHGFIYDQVIRSSSRSDLMFARRLLDASEPVQHAFPARPHADFADRIRARFVWQSTARRARARANAAAVAANASIVHAHFGMAGADVAEDCPRPLVTTFYGVDASACLRDPRWLDRYAPLFCNGARFIVLADAVSNRLTTHGVPSERIRVLEHRTRSKPLSARHAASSRWHAQDPLRCPVHREEGTSSAPQRPEGASPDGRRPTYALGVRSR